MKFSPKTDGVTMEKGRDGWTAKSWLLLSGDRYLQIYTRKTHAGLCSTATGVTVTDHGFMMELFGDFQEVLSRSNARCTEKSVKELHATATKDTGPVLERAIVFYAKKDGIKAMKSLSLDLSVRACQDEAMAGAA